jgi:hypothetical protein
MNLDPDEIVKKVDAHLTTHPHATLRTVAGKLRIKRQILEAILREKEGISFSEFKENKRLKQAISFLDASQAGAKVLGKNQRAQPLVIIPKTTVKYRIRSFWIHKRRYSKSYPIVALNSSGLAFLTDLLPKIGKAISLLLKLPKREEILRLEGLVISALATGVPGYSCRVGVKFLPFSERKGSNTLEALDILEKFEKGNHVL